MQLTTLIHFFTLGGHVLMNRDRWAFVAATVAALGWVLLNLQGVAGCHSAVQDDGLLDAKLPPQGEVSPPPADETELPGVTCDKSAGVVPAPDCFDGIVSCKGEGACEISNSCGAQSCLPMAANADPIYNFRMESLNIVAPAALADPSFQDLVISPAVALDDPSGKCGYGPDTGVAGTFNWLLSLNKQTNMLTTGAGGPVADPYKTGYCFLSGALGGLPISPLTVPAKLSGSTYTDGVDRFSTLPAESVVNIPIFSGRTESSTAIILPIQGMQFKDVGLAPDGNCIGQLDPVWVSTAGHACNPKPSPTCPKWFTGGALGGYMALKDADAVAVPSRSTSLCHLLVGGAGEVCTNSLAATYRCCAAGDIASGDYCSTGGSCSDSEWFSATFSANAVTIHDNTASSCGP
jgi:hypothetical protein